MDQAAEATEDPGIRLLAATLLEKRDPARAVEWMRRSAEAGHVDAMTQLAVWYANGRAKLEVDPAAALDWFTRAAKTGHVKSMYEVARMLQQGLGTATDVVNAIVWLERAAEGGMPLAMLKLGNCYRLGAGIIEDHAKAAEWWRRAAETGDKETIEMLRDQGYLI
jgi:TPR repeat protein